MRDFEKILAKLDYSIPKTASFQELTFDDVLDDQVKKELLLIQRVQKKNDPFAMRQLISMYRGMLTNAINKCPATSAVGYEVVNTYAVNSLKGAINRYQLENYKTAKPVTYFTGSVDKELKKLTNSSKRSTSVRMSDGLNDMKPIIGVSQQTLRSQLGREPSPQEIMDYAKHEMKAGGSGLTVDKIERIMHYETKELSGSRMVTSENADAAESITFEEVFGGNRVSTEEEYNKQLDEEKLITEIQAFTPDKQKRRFLMQMLGIGGEFSGRRAKTLSEATFNNGLTYHTARNTYEAFRENVQKKGML